LSASPKSRRHFELKDEMTEKDIQKMVVNLAWPSITEMFLMSLVGIADMIMVGRLGPEIGPKAISAVGLTNQPIFFAMAIFQALNVGTTALVARCMGAGNRDGASEAAKQTFVIVLILGALVGALGFFVAETIIRFMGAAADVIPMGTIYMKIVSLGLVFNIVAMGLSSVLRGSGDTHTPMRANMTANIVNVIGNYILIYGKFGFPALGVAGAAIATSFSRILSAVWLFYVITRGSAIIHIDFRNGYRFDWDIVRRIFKVGFPASIEQFVMRGGQMFFVRIVAGLGTLTYAAHQIALNVMSLSFMPGMGFGIAASTLIGMSLGAKRPDIAERAGYQTQKLGTMMASGMGILFFIGAPWIVGMYNSNPAVIAQGALALRVVAIMQPAQSTQFILAGGLRGAGDTKWPLYTTAIGVWGIRIVLAILFVNYFKFGLVGAWAAMAIDQLVRSILITYRYRSGHWKHARV
jgi:putative MATE family efflux protein